MNGIIYRSYPSGNLWGVSLRDMTVKKKVAGQWVRVTDAAEYSMYMKQLRLILDHVSSPKHGVGYER